MQARTKDEELIRARLLFLKQWDNWAYDPEIAILPLEYTEEGIKNVDWTAVGLDIAHAFALILAEVRQQCDLGENSEIVNSILTWHDRWLSLREEKWNCEDDKGFFAQIPKSHLQNLEQTI